MGDAADDAIGGGIEGYLAHMRGECAVPCLYCEVGIKKKPRTVRGDTAMTSLATTHREIQALLSEPFPVDELQFRPGATKGNRALALAYIDARSVQDRLDDVLGVAGWKDDYQLLPNGEVVCRLSVRVDGEWISKTDVGGQSEQPDEGDRLKAAFSDALKRAAVKFGIGRYIYSLPSAWVDYDPQRKQLTSRPNLPAWAIPKPKGPEKGALPPPADKPHARPAIADKPSPFARGILGENDRLISRDEYEVLDAELRHRGKKWEGLMKWLGKAADYDPMQLSRDEYQRSIDLLSKAKSATPA